MQDGYLIYRNIEKLNKKRKKTMKSKLLILSLLLAGASATATAQNTDVYYSESCKDNFFISVGVGMQAGTNPDSKFGQSITPLVNLSIGKLITPVWGVRGQLYGWQSKQKTAYPFFNTWDKQKRKENYVGINLDGMINLTNLFCGYKPGRVFEGTLFVGPSMNIARNYGSWKAGYQTVAVEQANGTVENSTVIDPNTTIAVSHKTRCLIGASVGLGAKFNINPEWAIDVEARGQVTPSILGAYSSASTDGYIYLSAGATWTIGGKKFVNAGKVDQKAINEELNKYRDALALAQAELADAANALANMQPEVVEVINEVPVAGPRAIFFKIGSAKIDDYGLVNIQLAAKIIKENPTIVYKVAGYCDEATGTPSWNKKLSEMRAQAVYDALIKEGVNKDQLQYVGFGGTANMFGKNFLNRVVILE